MNYSKSRKYAEGYNIELRGRSWPDRYEDSPLLRLSSPERDLSSLLRSVVGRLPRPAQAYTATSSGYIVTAQFYPLVCSGSKAEMDFGKVSFPLRVYRLP